MWISIGTVMVAYLGIVAATSSTPPAKRDTTKLDDTKFKEFTTEFERRVDADNNYDITYEETKRMLRACGLEKRLQSPIQFKITREQGTEITLFPYDRSTLLYQVPYNIAQGCLPKL